MKQAEFKQLVKRFHEAPIGKAPASRIINIAPTNINAQDNRGFTKLLEACYDGSRFFVDLLLCHGANPNIANDRGETPLMVACISDENIEIVKLLIRHGARLDLEDSKGRDAYWVASKFNCPNILKFLLELNFIKALPATLRAPQIVEDPKKDLNLI